MSKAIRVQATMDEVQQGNLGGCIRCGAIQEGCEPDARKYECESCGAKAVYGLEELVVMGGLDLLDCECD